MLEVEFTPPDESGNYFCIATQIGMNMGIPQRSKSSGSVIKPGPGIVPLSHDEFGRVSGWLKSFHNRPGSGFISNRAWGWNVKANNTDLEIIYNLATYGLK